MSTLAGTLELRDVKDVEALVRKVADDRLRSWGARLGSFDHEDLVSYLIGVCWELDGRYDPSKDRNPNFGAYAARILTLRVADWYRQRFGDTRHGDRPVVLSLDAGAALGDGEGEDAYAGRGRLVETLASGTGDPALDRSPDLVGVLDRGSGGAGRAHDPLGEPADRRAARGDRAAAALKPRVPPTSRPTLQTPICEACFKVFGKAFARADKALPEPERRSVEQLLEDARARAAAVKFAGQWVCTRCTTVPTADGPVPIGLIYPNRNARRRGEREARKGAKR